MMLKLPMRDRPNYVKAEQIPHPQRQKTEPLIAARRTGDPLTSIKAVLIYPLPVEQKKLHAYCHHLIPCSGQSGYGKYSFSTLNESQTINLPILKRGHLEIENGLSDPAQWSIIISILYKDEADQVPSISQWQLGQCAQLVRQCWRRYPNVRYVADARHFGNNDNTSNIAPDLRWDILSGLILDNSK